MQPGLNCLTLKVKALGFLETSVNIYMSIECNIPEDVILWIYKSCRHNEEEEEEEEEEEVSIQCQ
jgi:hypothetical protein